MQYSQLVNQSIPVLVDFYAEWCGPCKMMAPMIEQIKEEYGDKVKIYKIDIDKNQGLASGQNVQAVPTVILYRQGKPVWRVSGVPSLQELRNQLNNLV